MDLTSALWVKRGFLIGSFHSSIIHAMRDTWLRCASSGTPHEPDHVAGLVMQAMPDVHRALSSALAPQGISVSVAGVFCHQSPMVKHSAAGGRRCELGDLLIAFVHRRRTGEVVRNALLLQAKSSAFDPYTVGVGEKDQLALYLSWPDFEYTGPKILAGQKRKVSPPAPHAGAQYLLLDSRAPSDPASGLAGAMGTFPAGCAMPANALHIRAPLAFELFDLLGFGTGRPFGAKGSGVIDWTTVVWDLLEVGLTKAFRRKRSGRVRQSRSAGDVLFFTIGDSRGPMSVASEILGAEEARELFSSDGGWDVPNLVTEGDGDDDGGVSVVVVSTREEVG